MTHFLDNGKQQIGADNYPDLCILPRFVERLDVVRPLGLSI
ncbi:hypothetical protein [Hallella colorans]|nr:hypothetical protein [Hallella colorans]